MSNKTLNFCVDEQIYSSVLPLTVKSPRQISYRSFILCIKPLSRHIKHELQAIKMKSYKTRSQWQAGLRMTLPGQTCMLSHTDGRTSRNHNASGGVAAHRTGNRCIKWQHIKCVSNPTVNVHSLLELQLKELQWAEHDAENCMNFIRIWTTLAVKQSNVLWRSSASSC